MKKVAGSCHLTLTLVVLAWVAAPSGTSADKGPAHQVVQNRPISLGTSGGNIQDISEFFCCSGTLGSLVRDAAGTQYILSNNHVLARTNSATAGELITQPGLTDVGCAQITANGVATLSATVPISFTSGTTNPVDAAIAQTLSGVVNTSGLILDIGQVSTSTIAPILGAQVKKSGRTTGLTKGKIAVINLAVNISYNVECGIGSQVARFVNQFAITPGSFSKGGDSGSLIVENVATCPHAVGLLFAGGGNVTIANPISAVLSAFNVTPVGCSISGSQEKSLVRRIVAWLFPSASAADGPPVDPAAIVATSQVKERHEQALLSIQGVVGVGVGHSDVVPGQAAIAVFVERDTAELRQVLPAQLDGIPLKITETGKITAFGGSCSQAR